jgi:hypothetical protein
MKSIGFLWQQNQDLQWRSSVPAKPWSVNCSQLSRLMVKPQKGWTNCRYSEVVWIHIYHHLPMLIWYLMENVNHVQSWGSIYRLAHAKLVWVRSTAVSKNIDPRHCSAGVKHLQEPSIPNPPGFQLGRPAICVVIVFHFILSLQQITLTCFVKT